MAKVEYRITTVSNLDGKAVTKVFKNVDEAFETYAHLLRSGGNYLFATFGRRILRDNGFDSFQICHAHVSATAQSARKAADFDLRAALLSGRV